MLPTACTPAVLDDLEGRLRQLAVRRLTNIRTRHAAVLISLCSLEGAPAVLFTKRSDAVPTHKGHVSFPGGMHEDGDADAAGTALREYEEELGVPRDGVHVLGAFHEARAITGIRVQPVVGFLGEVSDLSRFQPSQAEIDSVFVLTLSQLTDPALRSRQRLGVRRAPVFEAGPHPVWGLTAMILESFLVEVLGAPATR